MIDDKKIGQVLVRPASVVANVLDLKNKHLSENEQWHCNNCGVVFMLQAEFCIILLAVWVKTLYCLHSKLVIQRRKRHLVGKRVI